MVPPVTKSTNFQRGKLHYGRDDIATAQICHLEDKATSQLVNFELGMSSHIRAENYLRIFAGELHRAIANRDPLSERQ